MKKEFDHVLSQGEVAALYLSAKLVQMLGSNRELQEQASRLSSKIQSIVENTQVDISLADMVILFRLLGQVDKDLLDSLEIIDLRDKVVFLVDLLVQLGQINMLDSSDNMAFSAQIALINQQLSQV